MLPDFDERGNLPPGRHSATWQEFEQRYGLNEHRRRLLAGMKRMLLSLKNVGCKTAYMNGSFITAKDTPHDYDGCWDRRGVDLHLLRTTDPVLLDFANGRAAQKLKYGGEMFPADIVEQNTGRISWTSLPKTKTPGMLRESSRLTWEDWHDQQ